MTSLPDFVAVIPARGGSKGIKRKNLQVVGSRSLLNRTIDAALESSVYSNIIVSSDSEEILSLSLKRGIVTHSRDPAYAEDDIHASKVAIEVCKFHQVTDSNYVSMLLPTAPFRTIQNLIDGAAIQRRHPNSSVIGVISSGKYLNNLRHISNGRLTPIVARSQLNRQRQGQNELIFVSGSYFSSSFYSLKRNNGFHSPDALPLGVSYIEGFDLNTMADLEFANLVSRKLHL